MRRITLPQESFRATCFGPVSCPASYNVWTKHGERGVMMEDGDEEENDDDNYRSTGAEPHPGQPWPWPGAQHWHACLVLHCSGYCFYST